MSLFKTKGQKVLAIIICAVVVIAAAAAIFLLTRPAPFKDYDLDGVQVVVCIGDSITAGGGVSMNASVPQTYPAQLQALLGDKYAVTNYGLPARTLGKVSSFPYWVEPEFTLSQEMLPDVVLIMLGTNDSKEMDWNAANYETDLEAFVKVYQSLASAPTVYILKPPAAFTLEGKTAPVFGIRNEVIADEILPIIDAVAKRTGASVIDIYAVTKDHPEFFADGVHPNAEGYGAVAAAIVEAMK